MLLVAGEEAQLAEEGHVAEAVIGVGRKVIEEGRCIEEQLDAAEGDELKSFAVVVDPGVITVVRDIAHEVGAKLLLEAGRDGDERGNPVGLLVLGGGDARLIAADETGRCGLLGVEGECRRQKQECGKEQDRRRATKHGEVSGHDGYVVILYESRYRF